MPCTGSLVGVNYVPPRRPPLRQPRSGASAATAAPPPPHQPANATLWALVQPADHVGVLSSLSVVDAGLTGFGGWHQVGARVREAWLACSPSAGRPAVPSACSLRHALHATHLCRPCLPPPPARAGSWTCHGGWGWTGCWRRTPPAASAPSSSWAPREGLLAFSLFLSGLGAWAVGQGAVAVLGRA